MMLEFSQFLKDLGYCEESSISADAILHRIPDDLKHLFFLGVSDGDGSFYYNRNNGHTKQYTLYGGYDCNCNYIEDLYKSLDVKYSINRITTTKGKSSSIRICGKDNIFKLGNYLYATYEENHIGLIRKNKVWNELKTLIINAKRENY